jgi:tetratricopeptide (TPR) repeat protein
MKTIEEIFWSYIRGDLDEAAFEAWVYDTPELDSLLAPEDFLAVAGSDYRDKSPRAYSDRKDTARDIISRYFPPRCVCLATRNVDKKSLLVSPLEAHVDVLAQRSPNIRLARCRECGTHWLMGYDTVDENVTSHRLSPPAVEDILARDRWPTVFDDQPNYWPKTLGEVLDENIMNSTDAIRRNPNDAAAFFSRGVSYVSKGDNESAFRDFDQAIRLRQDISWPFVRRGDCYRIKGDLDAALRDYQRAIDLNNDFYALRFAYQGRGELHRLRHNFEQAIVDYDRVLEHAPGFARGFLDRGTAFAELRDFDRAIQDFDRAIVAGQKLRNKRVVVDALVNRGAAYAAKGDDPRAIPDYDEALQIDRVHVAALYNRAIAKVRVGDVVGSNADLVAARAIDAQLIDSWAARGEAAVGSRSETSK